MKDEKTNELTIAQFFCNLRDVGIVNKGTTRKCQGYCRFNQADVSHLKFSHKEKPPVKFVH